MNGKQTRWALVALFLCMIGSAQAATYAQLNSLGVISVKEFGAVGDGVTDDTAEIQRFLAYFDLTHPNERTT